MNMQDLTSNLLTVVAELLLIILLFVVLNWIVRRIVRGVVAVPALRRFADNAESLRRSIRLLLLLVCLVLCVGVASASGYLMYKGENLATYTLELVQGIPQQFWMTLAVALAKTIGVVILAAIAVRWLRRMLDFLCARARAFEGIKANDDSIDIFFGQLKQIVVRGTWLLVLALSVILLKFPPVVGRTAMLALKIYLIIATGLLLWRGVDTLIASLDALSRKYSNPENLLRYYDKLSHLIPLLRRAIEYVIYVMVATLVVLQVEAIAPFAGWGPRLIRVIGVVFLSRVAVEVANLLVQEILISRARLSADQKQRRQTIVPLVQSIIKYGIYFSAAIFVLKEFGVNPTPVLAGAGIVGLAVGLGAQNLINDVLSGFFILFEEYFLVGDFIKAADAEGTVESIDLRTTRIRDNDGRQHILPNGQITNVTNYAKQYTYAVVEVGVAYESDIDKVFEVLGGVGKRLKEINGDVLEPTQVKGLQGFGESELTMRTVTKVKPGRHLQVERDLRKMIKEAFDEQAIEIPYARRVLIMQQPEGRVEES